MSTTHLKSSPLAESPKLTAKWEHVRKLAMLAKRDAVSAVKNAIEAGHGLAELQQDYGIENGNNQFSKREGVSRETPTLTFDQLIEQRTGLSRATAYRWIEYSNAYRAIVDLSNGHDTTRAGVAVKCTAAKRKLAVEAIMILEEEGINPLRLWAGVQGEGQRVEGGTGRVPTVYLALSRSGKPTGVLPESITTLRNGFKVWNTLDLSARAAFKSLWEETMSVIPEDLR